MRTTSKWGKYVQLLNESKKIQLPQILKIIFKTIIDMDKENLLKIMDLIQTRFGGKFENEENGENWAIADCNKTSVMMLLDVEHLMDTGDEKYFIGISGDATQAKEIQEYVIKIIN